MAFAAAALHVTDFASARSSELRSLSSVVDDGDDESRQFILKRRSRSHKRKYVGPSRRRAHRSMRHRLLTASDADDSSRRLLETHVWHAKRFEMTKINSWVVARRRRDRGLRAACRSYATHCIVWDATFETCIQVGESTAASYGGGGGGGLEASAATRRRIEQSEEEGSRGGESSWCISCDPRGAKEILFDKIPAKDRREIGLTNRFRLEGPKASWTASRIQDASWNGLEVVADPGRGRSVWNDIIMAGAHAVGLEERRHIRSVERGLPTFPHDFGAGLAVRLVAQGRGIPENGDKLTLFVHDHRPGTAKMASSVEGVVTTAAFSHRLGKGAGIARIFLVDDDERPESARASSWTASCISKRKPNALPFSVILSRIQ